MIDQINVLAPAEVDAFIAHRVPEFGRSVVSANDRMAMSYGVEEMPLMYLIGRDGRILDSYAGYAPEAALRRGIEGARKVARVNS